MRLQPLRLPLLLLRVVAAAAVAVVVILPCHGVARTPPAPLLALRPCDCPTPLLLNSQTNFTAGLR